MATGRKSGIKDEYYLARCENFCERRLMKNIRKKILRRKLPVG